MINQQFEKALESPDLEWRMKCLSIAIVGGGPTGVELAGALAEMRRFVLPKDYPDVDFSLMHLVLYEAAPRLLGSMSEKASEKARLYLEELGVDLRLGIPVKHYEHGFLLGADGSKLHTDTVLWTAGVEGAPIEGLITESLGAGNRIQVDVQHRVLGMDHVYALGDVALMRTDRFPDGHPMLAPVAQQQAKNLAANLIRSTKQLDPKPFRYIDKGSMATIGRNKAVVDLPGLRMQGALAWFIWMFVHVYSLIGFKNRLVALLDWSFSYFTYDRSLSLIIRPFRKPVQP
jgi:NADH dehydrogenase